MRHSKSVAVLAEMGTGKTLISIGIAGALFNENRINIFPGFLYYCNFCEQEKEINKLEKNIEYYKSVDIENKLIIKQKNRKIYRLRKKIKEMSKNVKKRQ